MRRSGLVVTTLLWIALPVAVCATPQHVSPQRSWPEEKCRRYQKAWSQLQARVGLTGLSASFIERHARFIAGGCTGPADVCPRTTRDFEIANIMTVLAMNAGMASTFPPFACPSGSKDAPPR